MDNHAKILILYSSEVNDQCTHKTSAHVLCQKKGCVLGAFLLLLFNAVNLLCSALFRETNVFSLSLPKHIIKSTFASLNICINNNEIILILVIFTICGSLLI